MPGPLGSTPSGQTILYEGDAGGGGTPRQTLVAHWTRNITKTNIGSAFVDIYNDANASGYELDVDFTGFTQVAATICWNKIGTGTQNVRVVQADDVANVLFDAVVVSGRNPVALVALPAWAIGVKRLKLQGKSTTSTDDPIFHTCAVYLK